MLALAGLASALGCAHARARWWPTRHLSPFACAARFASHLFRYGIPLEIVSYKELYGWSMDEIVKAVGAKSNCTFCGVLRRQALERGARLLRTDCIATGHNSDDVAETVLLNLLRGDAPRLRRCTAPRTGGEGGEQLPGGAVPRVKPLRLAYEKEIVMYAYFLKV